MQAPDPLLIREHILRCSAASGHGHIPTSFSVVEMILAAYGRMKHDPKNPKWEERDIFILSKGHAALGYYNCLAELGYFPWEGVQTFGKAGTIFGCHPDRLKCPGIEVSSGSLGHGIAVGVGMALAFKIRRQTRQVYALIGDGEANEGSVWESAMVAADRKLDNFTLLYDHNRSQVRCLQIPNPGERFAAFGFDAVDVDGHDLKALAEALAKPHDRPKAVICHTVKGKGCRTLSEQVFEWHRRSPKAPELEQLLRSFMRKQFKLTSLDLAAADERVVLVFGDISVFLFNDFQQKFPDRFYNLGICEQAIVSVGAGLSAQGFIPFVHSIAPFMTERAMEQIKLDCSYNNFPVNIVTCGATFDYAWDGATHHAWTDIAFMRLIPNTEVFQPGTPKEVDFLLRNHYASGKTSYFRLSDNPHPADFALEKEKGVVVRDIGADVTVITAGPILDYVLKATEGLKVNLLYFHTLKPFDHELVNRFSHTKLKVVHDSFGLFEEVCRVAGRSVELLGLPDAFCCSFGTIHDVRKLAGLSVEDIRAFIQK